MEMEFIHSTAATILLATSLSTVAQPDLAGNLEVALCRPDYGLARICRLRLALEKLGVRSYQRAYALHRPGGAMDLRSNKRV
jgi:hypothetical protein